MAVALECINIIVPIWVIQRRYLGGWNQYRRDNEQIIGGRIWYDDHLVRDGALNTFDIEMLLAQLKQAGVKLHKRQRGELLWNECCVVSTLGGPTLACDWLKMSNDGSSVHLKDQPAGRIVGPSDWFDPPPRFEF